MIPATILLSAVLAVPWCDDGLQEYQIEAGGSLQDETGPGEAVEAILERVATNATVLAYHAVDYGYGTFWVLVHTSTWTETTLELALGDLGSIGENNYDISNAAVFYGGNWDLLDCDDTSTILCDGGLQDYSIVTGAALGGETGPGGAVGVILDKVASHATILAQGGKLHLGRIRVTLHNSLWTSTADLQVALQSLGTVGVNGYDVSLATVGEYLSWTLLDCNDAPAEPAPPPLSTEEPAPVTPAPPAEDSGLSAGAIAGIAVGAVLAVVAAGVVLL